MPHSSLRRRLLLVPATLSILLAASPLAWADELVLDNADASVQVKGAWTATTTTPGFVGADYRFRTPGDGSSTVTWPFPANAAPGRYEVFARWSSGPNRAANATYRVTHAGGSGTVGVSQKVNGGTWQSLGTFDFQPNKGHSIMLHDRADGVVVADAVRWVGPVGGAPQPQPSSTPAPAPTPAPSAPAAPAPTPTPQDARYFAETRYRVGEDGFWDFFQKRGGVRTFGYPVSNTFTLLGMKVQMFQRQVLQMRPDGGVQTMNLLDEGLLPYTRINGSTFPAPDPEVIKRAPRPDQPDYHERALQFVREMAPDQFEGQPVNFARTFFGTVRPEDAFPGGMPQEAEGLLAGFNLEIWGLPTSRPTYEPTNPSFIYQRFQRGIMHYDKGCGCTQGLLLADYLKALATNRNLPADLAAQAKGSPFFAQWAFQQPQGLARPNELPGSNWLGAFRRDPSVTVDAGHGGKEVGASHTFPDGFVLQEKALNLRVATRLRELLQEAGYEVTLTRTKDAQVNVDNRDLTGDGKADLSDDLQARVDIANKARSDLFVSVHFNGAADKNVKGTYMFWDPDRTFADRNRALGEMIQAAMVKSLKDAGYTTVDRGARMDTSVLGGGHYYLLSPKTAIVQRPSEMPAVIGEPLFLSNTDDANAARNDRVIEAVARGYLDGIRAYFAKYPPS